MSELELVTLLVSLIVGLSVARILSSVALAIQARQQVGLHWLPLCWAMAIFLLHVQFLVAIFDLDVVIPAWTWSWLGPVLLLAVLLFLSGSLILPARDRQVASDLLGDFEVNGRLALVPVSLYLLLWVPLNVRSGVQWISIPNVLDVLLVVLAATAFFIRTPRVRAVATVAYLMLVAWGVFVIWSPGGLEWVGGYRNGLR